jgi:hypothetical protein
MLFQTDPRSIDIVKNLLNPCGYSLRPISANGSGISCCPVQAGVSFHCKNLQAFILQSQLKELATCTIVVYTHSDQHLIPDPTDDISDYTSQTIGSGISTGCERLVMTLFNSTCSCPDFIVFKVR